MKRFSIAFLVIVFGLVYSMSTVYADVAKGSPRRPFQQLNQKIDQANEQIREAKEQLEEVQESINEMPYTIYRGLRSGSKHWVSPYWDSGHTTVTGHYYSDKTASDTSIMVLNGSASERANGKLNKYDIEGNLLASINFEVEPLAVWTFTGFGIDTNMGWVEVIADKEIFLDGIIKYIAHHFFGSTFEVEDKYAESEHSRTMTWYPVKD